MIPSSVDPVVEVLSVMVVLDGFNELKLLHEKPAMRMSTSSGMST